METVQVGDMARELGVIRDASIVTALVSLLSIVPVLLEIRNARNVRGITGHFAACCRSRDTKNPQERHKKENESGKKKVY